MIDDQEFAGRLARFEFQPQPLYCIEDRRAENVGRARRRRRTRRAGHAVGGISGSFVIGGRRLHVDIEHSRNSSIVDGVPVEDERECSAEVG